MSISSHSCDHSPKSRRTFLKQSLTCGGYLAFLAGAAPAMMRNAFQDTGSREVVAKEAWGRIEKVAEGMWALISTPFESQSFVTVCNGGIIAGDKGVLAVETFMQPEGAKWLAEWAQKLTGRWPTDVVVTHFHSDHSAGRRGYAHEETQSQIWTTQWTHDQILKTEAASSGTPVDKITNHSLLRQDQANRIDLGNRQVTVRHRVGHTSSDVTIEVEDPRIVFLGDLFFNRMVPNYSDARPETLTETMSGFVKDDEALFVPGHGPLAKANDVKVYIEFLNMIQESAEESYDAGKTSEEAAKEFKLPEPFEKWVIFSPMVMPRAFAAWYRQFEGEFDDD